MINPVRIYFLSRGIRLVDEGKLAEVLEEVAGSYPSKLDEFASILVNDEQDLSYRQQGFENWEAAENRVSGYGEVGAGIYELLNTDPALADYLNAAEESWKDQPSTKKIQDRVRQLFVNAIRAELPKV